jgi:DHA1 family tetracycline resistance protein-like MFS transporter
VVAGFGGGGFGAVQAYISDISTPADRTKNFGLMGAAFGMSFTIGPVIGGLLATYIEIIGVLYVSMGIIFINICFIYFFLREPAHAAVDTSLEKKDFHLSPRVVSLLFITLVATIGFSAIHGASTQYYVDKFAMDSLHIGYILSIVGIGSIIYQGILVQYVRRILDEKQMIYLAFIVLSIGMYCVAIITPAYIFWLYASVVLFPIGMGSM